MQGTMPDTVRVFDTWVQTKRGLLHFDVVTTDEATALRLATDHLASRSEPIRVTSKQCRFCHSEPADMFTAAQQKQLRERGGFILHFSG